MGEDRLFPDITSRPVRSSVAKPFGERKNFCSGRCGVIQTKYCTYTTHRELEDSVDERVYVAAGEIAAGIVEVNSDALTGVD